MHHFTRTGFMAHAICGTSTAVGWFPVTEDKVEDDWRDRRRDQHLARGERGLVYNTCSGKMGAQRLVQQCYVAAFPRSFQFKGPSS